MTLCIGIFSSQVQLNERFESNAGARPLNFNEPSDLGNITLFLSCFKFWNLGTPVLRFWFWQLWLNWSRKTKTLYFAQLWTQMIVAWLTFSNLLYQFSRISQIQACAVYLVKESQWKTQKLVYLTPNCNLNYALIIYKLEPYLGHSKQLSLIQVIAPSFLFWWKDGWSSFWGYISDSAIKPRWKKVW